MVITYITTLYWHDDFFRYFTLYDNICITRGVIISLHVHVYITRPVMITLHVSLLSEVIIITLYASLLDDGYITCITIFRMITLHASFVL